MSSNLEIKLRENQERRERSQLLEALPRSLAGRIEKAEFIYSSRFFQNFPVPPGRNYTDADFIRSLNFSTYRHNDFDDIAHVREHLRSISMRFNAPFFCCLGKGPAFIMEEQIEPGIFAEIENLSDYRIYLAEKNFSRGFVFDQHVGYLPDNRSTNADEIVFEVVCFSE